MHFSLNNAGTTYQRMMNEVLQSQIGRNFEAYVNDMIINTKCGSSHLQDMMETFTTLAKYNLKLNPTKCMFRVKREIPWVYDF